MPPLSLEKRPAMISLALFVSTALCLQANQLDVVSYSYDLAPHVNYPDPNMSKLTDGQIVPDQSASPYTREAAVGWLRNPPDPELPLPAITFDLGELKYIDEIKINYVLWPSAGVRAPNEVRISYSMNGQEFLLEQAYTGFDGSDNDPYVNYTRNLSILPERKAARYVRLDFRQGPGVDFGPNRSVFHFIDEIAFYGTEIEDLNTPAPATIHQAVELEFETVLGTVYQIQSSPDLETWEDFGSTILGNGEIYQVFSSTKTEDRRFFRVRTND